MSGYKPDYAKYRLLKANEALADVQLLVQNSRWAACMNRLYYACFYAASALLSTKGIAVKTHTGMKTQFNLHFVKPGLVSKDHGKLYARLMDWREKGDYGDAFEIDANTILPLLEPVEEFVNTLAALVNSKG